MSMHELKTLLSVRKDYRKDQVYILRIVAESTLQLPRMYKKGVTHSLATVA